MTFWEIFHLISVSQTRSASPERQLPLCFPGAPFERFLRNSYVRVSGAAWRPGAGSVRSVPVTQVCVQLFFWPKPEINELI